MRRTTMALVTILDHSAAVSMVSGGLFAGAAAYISFAEVPALRKSGPNELWRFFPYMYDKAAKMQAPLTLICGASGVIYSLRIAEIAPFLSKLWFGASLPFIAMVPYTMIFMAPTNSRIIASNKSLENETEKQDLLNKWSKLHLVRTVTSLVAFGAMVFGCVKYSSIKIK